MKKTLLLAACFMLAVVAWAQTGREMTFQTWAPTPPMGWNSWDCFGPTVVESEVKANADYMAANLKDYGWEYVVVDIRWFVENDKAGGYNQTNPIYVIDEYGRYTPALNRFPSAAEGKGFKPLADYVHEKGLKFGIHLMRGVPKQAVSRKLPVKGAEGITCDMIANNDSACTWLRDNMKVDCTKKGAQEYYNSCFDMYAAWGVDFVKIDDLARPYHTGEIQMIRNAIDRCGRPMVLSISPGETPIEKVDHVKTHANMWRTVDDFWDNWSQLRYQFQICEKWAPHIAPGTWPDADMLPLGKISIRGERGAERWCGFSTDEQYTMMNLWTIFKSPLMFGGDLPQNDAATNALLTNRDVLYMHHYSMGNRQVSRNADNIVTWMADDPRNGDKFASIFNLGGGGFVNTRDALFSSGTISYLTTGYQTKVEAELPAGAKELALIVTDGGDSFDCDHADWINPVVTLEDGTEIDLTAQPILRSTCGWGSVHVNSNINGGKLSVDGKQYDKGFATHANSVLLFNMPEGAKKFTAIAGIDNTGTDQGSTSSVEFMVFAYDPTIREETTDQWTAGNVTIKVDPAKQKSTSGYIARGIRQQGEVEADIAGTETLYLVVTNGQDGLSYDHADWCNPVLVDAQGKETSLTTIAWESAVNGWNGAKINKNNDGNTISVAGTKYEKGFGVNAPSILTFKLPQGHNYVRFRSVVGHDDDVNNAPEGATMEFRVYTEDPAPEETMTTALNLQALGLAAGQPAEITEMWSGQKLGTFKDSEFRKELKAHASGLYRISPLNRTAGASVTVNKSTDECKAGQPYAVSVDVTGAEGGYIQIAEGDKVVAYDKLDDNGSCAFLLNLAQGEHHLTAYYSGTPKIAAAHAEFDVTAAASGVADIVADHGNLSVRVGKGCLEITAAEAGHVVIHTVDGILAKRASIAPGVNSIPMAPGLYIVNGLSFMVK